MIASPPPPTMSTSYCHSLHLPLSLCCYCVIELYWLVFLPCIFELYYCFVSLHIPLSLQWVPVYLSSPHPHVCLWLYFSCRKNDLFVLLLCIITRILPLTLTFLVDTLSASTIVEGSRPCPHPYKYLFKLRHVWCLASYHCLSDDSDVASVALSLHSISGF